MLRLIFFMIISWADICVCPTKDQSLSYSSDYSSSDAVFLCPPEKCHSGLKTQNFKTTTTTKMTTTCLALPSYQTTLTENVVSLQSEVALIVSEGFPNIVKFGITVGIIFGIVTLILIGKYCRKLHIRETQKFGNKYPNSTIDESNHPSLRVFNENFVPMVTREPAGNIVKTLAEVETQKSVPKKPRAPLRNRPIIQTRIPVNFNDIPSCSRNLGFEEESPNVQRTMSLTMDMNLTNAADGQFNRTEETMFFSPGQTSTPLRMMRSISVDEMYKTSIDRSLIQLKSPLSPYRAPGVLLNRPAIRNLFAPIEDLTNTRRSCSKYGLRTSPKQTKRFGFE